MTRPAWMDSPHEFREDVDDYSMCVCGIPADVHPVSEVSEPRVIDRAALRRVSLHRDGIGHIEFTEPGGPSPEELRERLVSGWYGQRHQSGGSE